MIVVKNTFAGASALVLALALSACGGGSGVASTPTPTPTPTPPPVGANSELTGTLNSETFETDAVHGQTSYPKNGSLGLASSNSTDVSFVYDASSGTYRVGQGGRTAQFSASQRDAQQSNAQITVYKRTSGNTTETLTLTKPGLSGRLTYRYVGAGFWQSTTNGASSVSGTLDAFTYGAATPSPNIPRTGAATYDIDLLGTIAFDDQPISLSGTGTMFVKFGENSFSLNGMANAVLLNTGQSNGESFFNGQGTLSASSNGFSGEIDLGRGLPTSSSLEGKFYGPDADEVGAVWRIGMDIDAAGVGTITGRKNVAPSLLTTPAVYQMTFGSRVAAAYTVDANGNQTGRAGISGSNDISRFTVGGSQSGFTYQAIGNSFDPTGTFQASDRVATESNATWSVYRNQTQGSPSELRLLQTGAGNPVIALTYTSIGMWMDRVQLVGSTYQLDRFFAIGTPTNIGLRPTTGTATYDGAIFGYAYDHGGGQYLRYAVDGTFSLAANFGTNTMTGTATAAYVNASGVRTAFSPWDMGATINQNYFVGNLATGSMQGSFYGPNYNEMAGTFSMNIPVAGTLAGDLFVQGAVAGVRR